MNISLTPTFERHIREKIDSGLYGNASEVVRAALRMMIETERKEAPGAHAPEPRAPHRGVVIPRLAALETKLREKGVTALRLVGSVARGDARTDSDVDVLIDVDPEAGLDVMDIIGLKHIMEDDTGYDIDLLAAHYLRPAVRDDVMTDAVTVFQ